MRPRAKGPSARVSSVALGLDSRGQSFVLKLSRLPNARLYGGEICKPQEEVILAATQRKLAAKLSLQCHMSCELMRVLMCLICSRLGTKSQNWQSTPDPVGHEAR